MARKMYRHSRRPAARVVKGESRGVHFMQQSRLRLIFLINFFSLVFIMLALRLVEVSVVGGGELPFKRLVSEPHLMLELPEHTKRELSQRYPTAHSSLRMPITDRNGMVLATSVRSPSLVANPSLIREPRKVANQLALALHGESADTIFARMNKPKTTFSYIKRHLDPSEQDRVNRLGIPGLFFENDTRRVYPFGGLTAHVVGYVDVDGRGIAGMEKSFDKKLMYEQEINGENNAALSLDIRLQAIVAEEVKQAMDYFKAVGGAGVILDMQNGEILSMVSLPTYDPHEPGKALPAELFNRSTLGVYELGSTFKTFTAAMALEKGVVDVTGGYDASGPVRAAGFTIDDYKPYYRWLSLPEIFAYSSNIGTVKMAMDVGQVYQEDFLRRLGMDKPLSIELPEKGQPLMPSHWKQIQAMTIAYGHGISVSPLHLVRGVASIAYDGRLLNLTMVKDGNKDNAHGERIVSEKTARLMRKLMRNVVQYGTASKAEAAGYRVGGKTGTAEKITGGQYSKDSKLVSFVATFPTDNPRYVVFVMVDDPKGRKETYGYATAGWVAAPAVSNIVSRMGPLYGIEPVFDKPDPRELQFWAQAKQLNEQSRNRHFNRQAVHAASY